jgi:hypothetical protein
MDKGRQIYQALRPLIDELYNKIVGVKALIPIPGFFTLDVTFGPIGPSNPVLFQLPYTTATGKYSVTAGMTVTGTPNDIVLFQLLNGVFPAPQQLRVQLDSTGIGTATITTIFTGAPGTFNIGIQATDVTNPGNTLTVASNEAYFTCQDF